jgi:shikimate kinase
MIRFGWGRRKRDADDGKTVALRRALAGRSIVLVGLMGCGKSSVGRRLAAKLDMPFVDADEEIERAAGKSISDIFADHGEAHFRDGERKVIQRLLAGGPLVLATGGGAYMNPDTRESIRRSAISIWLRAELAILLRRVAKRNNRPLLDKKDPETVMRQLIEARYPVYALADITVESRDVAHEVVVADVLEALSRSPALADAADVK